MLCPTCPGPGEGGRRVKCAQCGTDTGSAARVCVVCGALAPRRPSLVAGGPGASPAGAPSGSARFSTTRLRPGYDREDVDAFIEAVRDTFLGVRQPPLTADEIRTKMFMTTRLRPGYDEEEVDAFLGEAEARLRTACVGCGAEMGTARTCRRCGAPVLEHSPGPGTSPGACPCGGSGVARRPSCPCLDRRRPAEPPRAVLRDRLGGHRHRRQPRVGGELPSAVGLCRHWVYGRYCPCLHCRYCGPAQQGTPGYSLRFTRATAGELGLSAYIAQAARFMSDIKTAP